MKPDRWGEGPVRVKAEVRMMRVKPRIASCHQKLESGMGQILPQSPQKEGALLTSSLQNYEKTNFCWFKSPNWWHLFTVDTAHEISRVPLSSSHFILAKGFRGLEDSDSPLTP